MMNLVMLQLSRHSKFYDNVWYDVHPIEYLLCHWLGKSLSVKTQEETLDGSEADFETLEENYGLFLMLSRKLSAFDELYKCRLDWRF